MRGREGRNLTSTIIQILAILSVVSVIWTLWVYSLSFVPSVNELISRLN
ncbi:MAG: hypothetical protein M1162_01375 [Candidatus Thermoplasmatota archaeon]|nr:hypothetical protein [Candidatus Thermoplasmatota archaeon]